MGLKYYKYIKAFVFAAIVIIMALPLPAAAVVAPHNVEPFAKVSFTFDDGLANTLTEAAPTLAAHGLTGTSFATTDCIGMTAVPNTCAADPDVSYMSWEQLTELRDIYGWEIGGHSVSHPMLDTDGLTEAELAAEITGGKQILMDHGFEPTNFATPYGDYDNRVLAEIARSYASHRGFWDVSNNSWPYNDYILNNMQVQAGVEVSDVLARVDQAIAGKHWLILTFHGIFQNPSSDPEDYQYATADLNTIAAYVKTKQDEGLLKAVNIEDGLVTSDTNLLPNGDLAAGISGGWTTDTPANVVADAANNGSYPESQNSVRITAGPTGNSHFFSPKIEVQHTKTYMLQSFLNITARSGGELGYYIDEYNLNGDWVSGKWVKAKVAHMVSQENFTYTPSSMQVAKASLQVYVTPGSGITAYVDSFRWFALEEEATPPPPPPTENLLPNSSFDNGIADGWATNNSMAFTADSGGNGSPDNPESALRLLAGDSNASLFAPLVDVDHTLAYSVSAYLDIQTLTQHEVAFYIDEYDIGGNWLSGQYKLAKRDTGIEVIGFDYQTTSDLVKKSGLQVILVGHSGITGYLDDVKFLAPTSPPPPPAENLVDNGDFNNGIADGWATDDPENITPDSNGNGSPDNPDNSIKLVAGASDSSLSSPSVPVDSGKGYSIAGYLDLQQLSSSEVGFYIDEYDIGGILVGSQQAAGINVVGNGEFSFNYQPSSADIVTAVLRTIVTGGSGALAYLDNITWFEN